MELIIGGAYQGKLTYAVNKYGFGAEELCDLSLGFPAEAKKCFYHFEALTKLACGSGLTPEQTVLRLMPYIKDAVLISREVGCGIVPMEPGERLYREFHGAALRLIAKEAGRVTRIFCGLAEVLK